MQFRDICSLSATRKQFDNIIAESTAVWTARLQLILQRNHLQLNSSSATQRLNRKNCVAICREVETMRQERQARRWQLVHTDWCAPGCVLSVLTPVIPYI
jgi:hypothetical protein